jgi:hypothetical protein
MALKIAKALDLPKRWDALAANYFQTKEFLAHAERYNPCKQRYYLLLRNGVLEAGAIVYTLRIDLFTYLAIPSPLKMNIVGVPCSVSSSGLVGNRLLFPDLFEHLKRHEMGLLLALNLESNTLIPGVTSGRTFPTVIMLNRFQSWKGYLQSLRSDYRRRCHLLSRPFKKVTLKRGSCSRFDAGMYHQYRQVLKRSKGKLETLSLKFFQNLPTSFQLTTYHSQEDLLGWYITKAYEKQFYFFLGGIDYKLNKKFNTYFNILFSVVREGIEKGASLIDLGQTAEIPKTRLGGEIVEKFMIGYHTNRLLKKLLDAGKGILEYPVTVPKTHVFKKPL